MAKCGYKGIIGRQCPHDAVEGKNLCIFHLPAEEKDPAEFWKHFASYYVAQLEVVEPDAAREVEKDRKLWVFGEADVSLVQRFRPICTIGQAYDYRGFVFSPGDKIHNFVNFVFPRVDFMEAQFSGDLSWLDSKHTGSGTFVLARFFGDADFRDVQFQKGASFVAAEFSGNAEFARARFEKDADFQSAQFVGEASFWRARFREEAKFQNANFMGPVSFEVTDVTKRLNLTGATVSNQVRFGGTRIDDEAAVLLWGLNFAHGTSDVFFEKGHRSGRIVGPAGQVVFQDIRRNMNRVSFLHTDILTDRLRVRFANVRWVTDPRRFILDAKFTKPTAEWQRETGLTESELNWLPALFNTKKDAPGSETAEQKAVRQAHELQESRPLVIGDVERIAREIRASHERYGNYPDAGDYYVAEMNFRQRRLQWRESLPKKIALWLYWLVSRYGESPTKAGLWLLGWLALTSWLYLCKGFDWEGKAVRRAIGLDISQLWGTLRDFVFAILHTLPRLVPGMSRAAGEEPSSIWTAVIGISQIIFYVILTLFLLAIRRRFKR